MKLFATAAVLAATVQVANAHGGHHAYQNHHYCPQGVQYETRRECHGFGLSRHCHEYRVVVPQRVVVSPAAHECHAHPRRRVEASFERSFDALQGRLHCHSGTYVGRHHYEHHGYKHGYEHGYKHHGYRHTRYIDPAVAREIERDYAGPAD